MRGRFACACEVVAWPLFIYFFPSSPSASNLAAATAGGLESQSQSQLQSWSRAQSSCRRHSPVARAMSRGMSRFAGKKS